MTHDPLMIYGNACQGEHASKRLLTGKQFRIPSRFTIVSIEMTDLEAW